MLAFPDWRFFSMRFAERLSAAIASNKRPGERTMRRYRRRITNSGYTPIPGKQTVAIERSVSNTEFRSAEEIFTLAHAIDATVTMDRVIKHCDWQVERRKIFGVQER